jgi:predicted short-subunit dehydrogenase-like oxidoreductase (DUF2520 family)
MIHDVVLLGAGNLATSLAVAANNAGFPILQVYSRTMESASKLANLVGAEPICKLESLRTSASIYIVALPDDVITSIVSDLPELKGCVVHTSGSTPISVFEGLRAKGFGVFYPFQTFSRSRIVHFSNIPICLEASNDECYASLEQFASKLSGTLVPMSSEQRRWLHLSGVFACNFTNHMLALAYQLTTEHQISFEVVKPLVEETIRKAFEGNPALYQTGPAVRNDIQTMERHAQMLKAFGLADLYKELSLSIQKLSGSDKGLKNRT